VRWSLRTARMVVALALTALIISEIVLSTSTDASTHELWLLVPATQPVA
jgi:hypothetical protein